MATQIKLNASSEDVQLIRDWLLSQPHLPDHMDELVIKKFLFRCNHSLQVTKEYIEKYYTLRSRLPEVFTNRDPKSEEFKEGVSLVDIFGMPQRTKENYTVSFYRIRDLNHKPEDFRFSTVMKYGFMVLDYLIAFESLCSGEICIIDMAGVTLKHLGQMVFSLVKIGCSYSQQAQPMKLCEIHIMNTLPIADKIFTMFKPFIQPEYFEIIHFHKPESDDIFDFVPKNLIPNEYGGTAGSLDTFRAITLQKIDENRDFYLNELPWKVIEEKRSSAASDIMGVGSFKTLDID